MSTDLPVEHLTHLGLNSNQLSLVLNLLLLPHLMIVVRLMKRYGKLQSYSFDLSAPEGRPGICLLLRTAPEHFFVKQILIPKNYDTYSHILMMCYDLIDEIYC